MISERFAQVVAVEEDLLRLDEAAMLIAAHGTKGLDVDAQLARLDELAERVREPTLDGLRGLLFRDMGFNGNGIDYYDPRNSYLDAVLDRRTGIPITLSIVALEVGRRVGVPLAGVSMPGHFLLRDKVDPSVFVDPYARGALLDRDGCRARFMLVQGPDAVFDDAFLEPVGKLAIIDRVLANLELVAGHLGDRSMLGWVLALRGLVPGAGPEIDRRLAAVLAADGNIEQAADVLELLAENTADAEVAALAAADAARLRARLN
jgi:regulator of sirC expression with transglutaminase-like and TPR domain